MKQCLSVTRRSAFSHCRINLVNSRRNCKGVTFVAAWDCAPELATGPARSVLQLQTFVFKLLLVDQELSQEQNSQGKPAASRHFVVPNKQRALKWQLGARVLPEQANQPKDTARWEAVPWPTQNPAWAAVWNLSTPVQSVRGLNTRRVWRAWMMWVSGQGHCGFPWNLPSQRISAGSGQPRTRDYFFPDSAPWQISFCATMVLGQFLYPLMIKPVWGAIRAELARLVFELNWTHDWIHPDEDSSHFSFSMSYLLFLSFSVASFPFLNLSSMFNFLFSFLIC